MIVANCFRSSRRLRMSVVFAPVAAFTCFATANATAPVLETDLAADPIIETGPQRGGGMVWPTDRVNYLFEMDQIAQFLDIWQEKTVGDPEFGGEIEAEAGPLGDVIQTDNTLEAIWFWSRYTELTGRTTYLQNIADAWVYSLAFPPWLEEGPVNGYYRAHNCAWALTAESAYRSATGDDTYLGYAETAATWLVDHPLPITGTTRLNAFVQGWTSGNLYLYGEELGNSTWTSTAVTLAQDVLDSYVAVDPATNLATEQWAMSSGTIVWGLCNSVFRADPVAGNTWVTTFGGLVDLYQDWYNVPADSFDWDRSWNVAYANAHFAMFDVTGDMSWFDNGVNLTNLLLSYDSDDDGGIPATVQDPVTEDMTWVTSYLGKFGVDRMIGLPPTIDAGVLRFVTLADGDELFLPVGAAIPIQVEVSNFGLDDLTSVDVSLEGPVTGAATVDLAFAEKVTIELHPGWLPDTQGEYEFTCRVSRAGDEDASNDDLTIRVTVLGDPASVENGEALTSLRSPIPQPNPFRSETQWTVPIPEQTSVETRIYGTDGRLVQRWSEAAGPAREATISWDGSDRQGRPVAAGVYHLRTRIGAGDASQIGGTRLVVLR